MFIKAINNAPRRALKVPAALLDLEKTLKKDWIKANKEALKEREKEAKAVDKAKDGLAKKRKKEEEAAHTAFMQNMIAEEKAKAALPKASSSKQPVASTSKGPTKSAAKKAPVKKAAVTKTSTPVEKTAPTKKEPAEKKPVVKREVKPVIKREVKAESSKAAGQKRKLEEDVKPKVGKKAKVESVGGRFFGLLHCVDAILVQ